MEFPDNQEENINNVPEQKESPLEPTRPGFFELIYGTLFSPVQTFTKISEDPPIFLGFLIYLLVTVLTSIAGILVPQDISDIPDEVSVILSQAGPSVAIFGAVISIIFWFVQAGILQVVAELLGGKGKALGILTVLALAGIPGVVGIPFQVAAHFLVNSFIGTFISIAGTLLVSVWWLVLLVIGLRQIHYFSTGKAIATVLAPVFTGLLLIIIMFLTMFVFITPFLDLVQ